MSSIVVIIDRFEGDFAVVELPDKRIVNVPRVLFPPEALEGCAVRIELDSSETRRRKEHINGLMKDLWEKE